MMTNGDRCDRCDECGDDDTVVTASKFPMTDDVDDNEQ